MTDKTNEFGAALFLSAAEGLSANTGDRIELLRAVARGYKYEHDQIVKANKGKLPKGKALHTTLRKRLTNNDEPSQVAKLNSLSEVGCDVLASGMQGSRIRDGLLWIADNDEQFLMMVEDRKGARLEPAPLYQAWTRHFRKVVKEAYDEGDVSPKDVLGVALPGVTASDAEAEINRLDDLAAKREAKKTGTHELAPTIENLLKRIEELEAQLSSGGHALTPEDFGIFDGNHTISSNVDGAGALKFFNSRTSVGAFDNDKKLLGVFKLAKPRDGAPHRAYLYLPDQNRFIWIHERDAMWSFSVTKNRSLLKFRSGKDVGEVAYATLNDHVPAE